jgi:hypothetical protein
MSREVCLSLHLEVRLTLGLFAYERLLNLKYKRNLKYNLDNEPTDIFISLVHQSFYMLVITQG